MTYSIVIYPNIYSLPEKLYSSNPRSIEALWGFYEFSINSPNNNVVIDFDRVVFCDANLAAVLIVIIENLKNKHNISVSLPNNLFPNELDVFTRNGLLGYLTNTIRGNDEKQSTIPIGLFDINENTVADKFSDYIRNQLLGHRCFSTLVKDVKDNLISHFLEIFANAEEHSNSKIIAVCGQYYSGKQVLRFTMADLGDGFFPKINNYCPEIKTVSEALSWAIEEGNTTRQIGVIRAGGTGLSALCNFLSKTQGTIDIICNNYYWSSKNNKSVSLPNCNCIGTTIHITFNLGELKGAFK